MRQKMLRARVLWIWRHLIEIVRHECRNEYLEERICYRTNDDIPLQIPIILNNDRFQYYNLSALNNYGEQTQHQWDDFWPETESEGKDNDSWESSESASEEGEDESDTDSSSMYDEYEGSNSDGDDMDVDDE